MVERVGAGVEVEVMAFEGSVSVCWSRSRSAPLGSSAGALGGGMAMA